MKFGTELVLEGRRFLGGVNHIPPPRVRGASGTSAMHFDKNFMKQKLQGTPDLAGVGHLFGPQIQIWKDLGPMVIDYEGKLIKLKL